MDSQTEEETDPLGYIIVTITIMAVIVVCGLSCYRRINDMIMKETYMREVVMREINKDNICVEELGPRTIHNQNVKKDEYWRLHIACWPSCYQLRDGPYGIEYQLECGISNKAVIHTSQPLPVQKFSMVEFTVRGQGGLMGAVTFGLTVRPPPAHTLPGDYANSYGYSSDGYSHRGDDVACLAIPYGSFSKNDIISIVTDRVSGNVYTFKNGQLKDTMLFPVVRFQDERGWGIYPCVGVNGMVVQVAMNTGTEPFRGPTLESNDLRNIYFAEMALGASVESGIADRMHTRGRQSVEVDYNDVTEIDLLSSSSDESVDITSDPGSVRTLRRLKSAVSVALAASKFGPTKPPLERLQKRFKQLEKTRGPDDIFAPVCKTNMPTKADMSRCRRKDCVCRYWELDPESSLGLCCCGHGQIYHRALPGTREDEEHARNLSQDDRLNVAVSFLEEKKKKNFWRRGLFMGHRFFYHIRTHEVTYEPQLVENPSHGIRPQSTERCGTCDGHRRKNDELVNAKGSIREWRRHKSMKLSKSEKGKKKVKHDDTGRSVAGSVSTKCSWKTSRSMKSTKSGRLAATLLRSARSRRGQTAPQSPQSPMSPMSPLSPATLDRSPSCREISSPTSPCTLTFRTGETDSSGSYRTPGSLAAFPPSHAHPFGVETTSGTSDSKESSGRRVLIDGGIPLIR